MGCRNATSIFFQQFYFTILYFIWIKHYFKLPKTILFIYSGLPNWCDNLTYPPAEGFLLAIGNSAWFQDRKQNMTVRTGQTAQDTQNRMDRQNRTADRTGQTERDRQNGTDSTGQPKQDRLWKMKIHRRRVWAVVILTVYCFFKVSALCWDLNLFLKPFFSGDLTSWLSNLVII